MEKQFPLGTDDFYGHLGLHEQNQNDENQSHEGNGLDKYGDEPEAAQSAAELNIPGDANMPGADARADERGFVEHDAETNTLTFHVSKWAPKNIIKKGWPYALIFAAGLFLYLSLFTSFSVVETIQKISLHRTASKVETTAAQIPSDKLAAYQTWIRSYFFDVSDPRILDPDYDISGNGLTNYQKFLLGLNPKKKDTLGLGMTDTEALISGIDPLTGNPLTDSEKNIIAANIDLEAISNKLSLLAANLSPKVAGANTDGLFANVAIDQNVPGIVDIPSLNVSAPLIWTQDTNNFEKDLTNGLVHYPGTPMPGEMGTAYISGHSSNYAWIKSQYNDVFAKLDQMKKYDSFSIRITSTGGKQITFHYVVRGSGIFKADDQQQFASVGKSTVGLSTCWPVGTSAKRLVVFGELTQVEQ